MLRRNVSRLTKEGALDSTERAEENGDRQVGPTLGGSKATKEQRSGFEVVRDCFTEEGDSVVGVFCLELLQTTKLCPLKEGASEASSLLVEYNYIIEPMVCMTCKR